MRHLSSAVFSSWKNHDFALANIKLSDDANVPNESMTSSHRPLYHSSIKTVEVNALLGVQKCAYHPEVDRVWSSCVSQLVVGTSQHLIFSRLKRKGIMYVFGFIRWNIHVSAGLKEVCCQAVMSPSGPEGMNRCLVNILTRKGLLIRNFFGTGEVCAAYIVDYMFKLH